MNAKPDKTPLARNLGAFFGHIWKAIRTEPGKRDVERNVVRKTVEEERRGDVVLRRTTIEEIEMRSATERRSDEATEGGESRTCQ